MQALFLIFLAAAWLSELVLAVGLAQDAQGRRGSLSLGLASGVAVLLMVLLDSTNWLGAASEINSVRSRLLHFLFAFGFMCVVMQLADGRARPARLRTGLQRWRIALPLLSGNVAVIAHSIMAGAHKPTALLAASVGLTVALVLAVPIAIAAQDRLQVSLVPVAMRGIPIVMLSAALAALGLMGLGPVLPW